MKKLFSILLFSCLTLLVSAQDDFDIVQFEEQKISLGKVIKGEKIKNKFVFTNISDEDVQIDLVSTCECTQAQWPKRPIKPGDQGTIEFVFDSSQKDDVVPVDIDVYFLNIHPKTKRPYSIYLQYDFEY